MKVYKSQHCDLLGEFFFRINTATLRATQVFFTLIQFSNSFFCRIIAIFNSPFLQITSTISSQHHLQFNSHHWTNFIQVFVLTPQESRKENSRSRRIAIEKKRSARKRRIKNLIRSHSDSTS